LGSLQGARKQHDEDVGTLNTSAVAGLMKCCRRLRNAVNKKGYYFIYKKSKQRCTPRRVKEGHILHNLCAPPTWKGRWSQEESSEDKLRGREGSNCFA